MLSNNAIFVNVRITSDDIPKSSHLHQFLGRRRINDRTLIQDMERVAERYRFGGKASKTEVQPLKTTGDRTFYFPKRRTSGKEIFLILYIQKT